MRRMSRVSSSWKSLDVENILWCSYFHAVWPRLGRRWDVAEDRRVPWRKLFRERWSTARRKEDALEEDWLDFDAAQDLVDHGAAGPTLEELNLQVALQQFRQQVLESKGVFVPNEPDPTHRCQHSQCRLHRIPEAGCEAFVCEESGALHVCRRGVACEGSLVSEDDGFHVCPISGHTVLKSAFVEEGETEEQGWDPELSMSAQIGRWFEQGYGMSEEQADDFFGARQCSQRCC